MAKLKRRVVRGKLHPVWYAWIPKQGGGHELISTGCTDKKAAAARAADLERGAVDPAYAAAGATTTQRILVDYVRSRMRMKRAAETVEFVKKKSGHLLRLLPEFTAHHSHAVLLEYIDKRQGEGAKNTTILKELRVYGAAWKLARRNQLVTQSLDELKPELDDDGEAKDRWLEPWELVALATVLPPRRMAVVAFACATGCDPGALWRASATDVARDFTQVQIHGTKRKSRERTVPVPLPEQRSLLRWALQNADGAIGGRLFGAWPNLRNDVAKACEKLGMARCSPNDWRRTYAKWLRNAGVEPQLIGAAMGHNDSRMVERVYGRLPSDALTKLLMDRTGGAPNVQAEDEAHAVVVVPDWDPLELPTEVDPCVRYVSGSCGSEGLSVPSDNPDSSFSPVFAVPRDGIEPPTRGFSIRSPHTDALDENGKFLDLCPVCVRSHRAYTRPKVARIDAADVAFLLMTEALR
jgi:integrase